MTTLQFDIYDKDFLCDTSKVKDLRREPNENQHCYLYDSMSLSDDIGDIRIPPVAFYTDTDAAYECRLLVKLWKLAGHPPARFEFLRTNDENGVLVFDAEGNLLFHAVGPTLGYNGSGSILSRIIMRASGFSDEDFEMVNAMCREKFTYRLGVLIKPS